VETNDRGALHLHGHLWLDANIHLPTLLNDMGKSRNEGYKEQVCEYIDSVFSEVRQSSFDTVITLTRPRDVTNKQRKRYIQALGQHVQIQS
jgi:hypothetical protein